MTLTRAFLFLAIGVLVGGIVAHIVTGNAWYAIAWGSAALVASVLGIVVLITSLVGGTSTSARGGRTWWIVTVAAIVGLLAVLVPSAPALIAGPPASGPARPSSSDLRTGDGPQAVVAAMIAATGQSKFTELGFLVDHATALAPSKPGVTTLELWDYRWGHAIHLGPESADADDAEALFDARDLDFAQIGPAVKKASAFTGMAVNRVTHVVVQRTFGDVDGSTALGAPTIEVLFDDGHYDAHVSYDFDLTMVEKGGSLFGG
ncbi:MAG TPA: hypothetical protein VGM38_02915 [Pseudolysinimonas sp.]